MELTTIVSHLKKELQPQSIICYGSYAQGNHDEKSDIDLLVLLNQDIPSEDYRKKIYSKCVGARVVAMAKNSMDWDLSWSPVNDQIRINQQAIDIGYNKTSWVKLVIDKLINKNEITFVEFPFRPYTFLGLLEASKILFDKDEFITSCLSQIRPMPKAIKLAIIHENLPILKECCAELDDYTVRHIGIIAFQFQLFRGIDALTSLLFALNEIYDPASKRIEKFLFRLEKKPPKLEEFVNHILPRFYENQNLIVEFFQEAIFFIENNLHETLVGLRKM